MPQLDSPLPEDLNPACRSTICREYIAGLRGHAAMATVAAAEVGLLLRRPSIPFEMQIDLGQMENRYLRYAESFLLRCAEEPCLDRGQYGHLPEDPA